MTPRRATRVTTSALATTHDTDGIIGMCTTIFTDVNTPLVTTIDTPTRNDNTTGAGTGARAYSHILPVSASRCTRRRLSRRKPSDPNRPNGGAHTVGVVIGRTGDAR